MKNINPASPLGFLMVMLDSRIQRARKAERGASAVEWVIISAIVVAICIAVSVILKAALTGKATGISKDIGDQ
jgi:Flp pilus assembly pilin Flp